MNTHKIIIEGVEVEIQTTESQIHYKEYSQVYKIRGKVVAGIVSQSEIYRGIGYLLGPVPSAIFEDLKEAGVNVPRWKMIKKYRQEVNRILIP